MRPNLETKTFFSFHVEITVRIHRIVLSALHNVRLGRLKSKYLVTAVSFSIRKSKDSMESDQLAAQELVESIVVKSQCSISSSNVLYKGP